MFPSSTSPFSCKQSLVLRCLKLFYSVMTLKIIWELKIFAEHDKKFSGTFSKASFHAAFNFESIAFCRNQLGADSIFWRTTISFSRFLCSFSVICCSVPSGVSESCAGPLAMSTPTYFTAVCDSRSMWSAGSSSNEFDSKYITREALRPSTWKYLWEPRRTVSDPFFKISSKIDDCISVVREFFETIRICFHATCIRESLLVLLHSTKCSIASTTLPLIHSYFSFCLEDLQ